MDSKTSTTGWKRFVRPLILVAALFIATLAPVRVDWETSSVLANEAICQGPDCMPANGWTCQGREDKCNMMWEECRDSNT